MLSNFQRLEYKYLTKAQETKQQLPLERIPKGLLNSLSLFSLSRISFRAFPSYAVFQGRQCKGQRRSRMTLFVSCFRSAKSNAKSAISAHAVQMQTTPFRQLLTPESPPISSPCWTPGISQVTTCLGGDSTESLSAYNRAMDEIAGKVAVDRKPLTSQLDSWENSTVEQRQYYIQKQLKTAWSYVMG